MISTGLIVLDFAVAAVVLFAFFGIRLDGWGGILLGACGVVYCVAGNPGYLGVAVFPLPVVLIVVGVAAISIRHFRKSD
jgi:hypothetical protein